MATVEIGETGGDPGDRRDRDSRDTISSWWILETMKIMNQCCLRP